MEVIVVGHDHLAVPGQLEVELQGVHVQVQGVFHRGDGVLRHQAGAAAVGLDVDDGFVLAGREGPECQDNKDSFHCSIDSARMDMGFSTR